MFMSPVTFETKNYSAGEGLCIALSLPGKDSIMTFAPQHIDVGAIFYAVLVVTKESRRLVLLRTSCLYRYLSYRSFLVMTTYSSVGGC
jgi:hypothetical protein